MAVWGDRRRADLGDLALMSRRFPPHWSVEETDLPSSPDRNVDNGRGQGIPEVSRTTNLQAQNQ
jgi:hypothetical protein